MKISLNVNKLALLNLVLGLLVVMSAIAVVYAKYQNRITFIAFEQQQKQRDKLNVEWGKLQLEQSTWATHSRIEELAQKKLGMKSIEYEKIVFIKP